MCDFLCPPTSLAALAAPGELNWYVIRLSLSMMMLGQVIVWIEYHEFYLGWKFYLTILIVCLISAWGLVA